MQEIVRFSIKVEQGFPGVTKAIKTYLDPNDWLEDHMKSFCQAVAVNSEKNIISSEGSIYAFDYDDLFPGLINNIVKKHRIVSFQATPDTTMTMAMNLVVLLSTKTINSNSIRMV